MSGQAQSILNSDEAGSPISRTAYVFVSRVICVVLVFAGVICCIACFDTELGPWEGWALAMVWLWIAIFVHEIGHAVAAKACGWKVVVFAAGPFGYHFHNREFAIIPRSKRAELAGFVLPSPSSVSVWTRYRAAAIHAGGPLASMLLAIFSGAAAIAWRNAATARAFDISLAGAGLSLMSAATALSTLTPSRTGKHPSDIQNFIRRLRSEDPDWRHTRAFVRLHALSKHKIRLRDLPLWMVDDLQAQARADDALRRGYDALIIGIVLDTPPVDRSEARALLDEFRQLHGDDTWLACCDAYFSAIWEEDTARARSRLCPGAVEDELKPLACAAEAAVLAREGDSRAARAKLQKMRELVRKASPFRDATFQDIGRQIEAILPA